MKLKINQVKIKGALLGALFLAVIVFLFVVGNMVRDGEIRSIIHEEFSPDQSDKVIAYTFEFDQHLFSDYYLDYFPNKMVVSVRDAESGRERYVYTGEERTGNPHWLSNEYLFFTSYCGTACQGLYLVDTRSKETLLATISYIFERGYWQTHFKDWFGGEFLFDGIGGEVRSEMFEGKTYLIFITTDGNGNTLGKKKFLFSEEGELEGV